MQKRERKSGILMPIFSIPSEYGIGDFGSNAYKFIDILQKSGNKIWQVLPLVQTGFGNSPYSSVASESFSPYYISPEILKSKGLLTDEDLIFTKYSGQYVDYEFLYRVRYPLLRKAYSRFNKSEKGFIEFIEKKKFYDYAMFMAIKYAYGDKPFYSWQQDLKTREKGALDRFYSEYSEEVLFWQFIQYEASLEWKNLKEYANKKGIEIFGDMPLYVALDSVDVWKNPNLFKLDENYLPTKVAGVPPDYFCADGQLWGNPVYNYEEHQKNNFLWWRKRLKNLLEIFDLIRIDHFRGLDRYYEIPAQSLTAKVGEWVKVPSKELFSAVLKEIPKSRIVAEDLGIIDDSVRNLMQSLGFSGMKILSFAFNGEPSNPYLPENILENSVCYTGTHDNDTLKGLIQSFSEWDYNNFICGVKNSAEKMGINLKDYSEQSLIMALINMGLKGKSQIFITTLSDILCKGREYRINEPGSVKLQNWSVKYSWQEIEEIDLSLMYELNKKYQRV